MIKINVAEIKKRLVGKKDFSYELKPAELNITEADLPLTGTVTVKGTISNVGDVLLLDEPFKGYDIELKKRIIPYIVEFSQNALVVLVTHNESEAALAGGSIYLSKDR